LSSERVHNPNAPDGKISTVELDGLYPAGAEPRPDLNTPTDFVMADNSIAIAYEAGLEFKARSQWSYVRRRFFRHRLAMGSLIVLTATILASVFASRLTSYEYTEIDFQHILNAPTTAGNHYFGTDFLGRDYFTRVLYGIRTSIRVALLVAVLSTGIGTAIGVLAGYFGGWLDNLLMRFTDLVLTLPLLAVLLVAANKWGGGDQYRVAVLLALLFWTGIARVVRGTFLSLREKEYVEAAKAAGAGDLRIMLRHMLPNAMGPIIVNMTLITAAAILTEAALSFLGFGIKPPTPALGQLIADGQNEMQTAWWLVVFPGIAIMILVLCINFIGDGLRDALDPTQRRVRA
jgi:ABC-type dipeptide/oligopeptide/nickel transport system permease subunit